MKKNNKSALEFVLREVVYTVASFIYRKLYCGEVCVSQQDKRTFDIFVKSIYGIKFVKLRVDVDPDSWNLRFRIYHDWYTYSMMENNPNKNVNPIIKTLLLNNLTDYIEKDEIKYIINYFSEASRNNYKYFRNNLSVLHKGKKSFWNYLKYWFKWPKKRPI